MQVNKHADPVAALVSVATTKPKADDPKNSGSADIIEPTTTTTVARPSVETTALAFEAMNAPVLEAAHAVPMILTGLHPHKTYDVQMFQPDAWDHEAALTRNTALRADAKGEIHLGEAEARQLLGVPAKKKLLLTDEEKGAASIIFSKLLDRVPLEHVRAAQPEVATAMNADEFSNTIRVVAKRSDGIGQARGYEQSFMAAPDGVHVEQSDPVRDGFVGEMHFPPTDPAKWGQPWLVLGGSGGSINSDRAREIVASGRPVLALKYFTYDGDDEAVRAGV